MTDDRENNEAQEELKQTQVKTYNIELKKFSPYSWSSCPVYTQTSVCDLDGCSLSSSVSKAFN